MIDLWHSIGKRGKHKVVGKISNVMKHLPAFDVRWTIEPMPVTLIRLA